MRADLQKPRLFIGSSSEGLKVAKAVFACVADQVEATLWHQGLFVPGQYPLEILEQQLDRHEFAIFVASSDDLIMKRGAISNVARDNIMVEFGLFAGVLGRRCVFIICPSEPKIDLPSDLLGIVVAKYDAGRIQGSLSDVRAAVEVGCQEILQGIETEWTKASQRRRQEAADAASSQKGMALRRLYAISSNLRDTIPAVQRDALAALSDREAFDNAKLRAAGEVDEMVDALADDAKLIGVAEQLDSLKRATSTALRELPFPQELATAKDDGQQMVLNAGFDAWNTFRAGGDPFRSFQGAAEKVARGKVQSLKQRYMEWWDSNSSAIHRATFEFQDALFLAISQLPLQRRAD
jgi:predicted nucleotide-binding protein